MKNLIGRKSQLYCILEQRASFMTESKLFEETPPGINGQVKKFVFYWLDVKKDRKESRILKTDVSRDTPLFRQNRVSKKFLMAICR